MGLVLVLFNKICRSLEIGQFFIFNIIYIYNLFKFAFRIRSKSESTHYPVSSYRVFVFSARLPPLCPGYFKTKVPCSRISLDAAPTISSNCPD